MNRFFSFAIIAVTVIFALTSCNETPDKVAVVVVYERDALPMEIVIDIYEQAKAFYEQGYTIEKIEELVIQGVENPEEYTVSVFCSRRGKIEQMSKKQRSIENILLIVFAISCTLNFIGACRK